MLNLALLNHHKHLYWINLSFRNDKCSFHLGKNLLAHLTVLTLFVAYYKWTMADSVALNDSVGTNAASDIQEVREG